MVARGEHASAGTDDLIALDIELGRLIRRAGRQRRQIPRMPQSSEARAGWSATIDEGLTLVSRIERAPANDLADLAVKFRAILWRIQTDEGVVLDEGLQHSLRRFGRQLARMARE